MCMSILQIERGGHVAVYFGEIGAARHGSWLATGILEQLIQNLGRLLVQGPPPAAGISLRPANA